jgi:hypothetical protein
MRGASAALGADASWAGANAEGHRSLHGNRRGTGGQGQIDRERTALARRALHVDDAAEVRDDRVNECKPETRAAAYFLGRKGRLEDARSAGGSPGTARNIPITAVNTISETTRGFVSARNWRARLSARASAVIDGARTTSPRSRCPDWRPCSIGNGTTRRPPLVSRSCRRDGRTKRGSTP